MTQGVYERISADERFERSVDRSGECHLWTGSLSSAGYANFWLEGRYIGAHVFAWTRVHGPLQSGQMVRHGPCHTRHCVRLEHLNSGTKDDNNRDRVRDGTQARGSNHHSAKLTEDQVREAKRLHDLGVSWARLGRDLGVDGSTIARAVTHKRGEWKHVDFDA